MTKPYREQAERLIGKSHRQVVRSTVHDATTGNAVNLYSAGGSLTMAEDWSPYIKATLTVPSPGVTLDPRKGDRVSLFAGYVYPGGAEDVHQVASGYVRSVSADQPGDSLQVEFWSAEGRTQDALWMGTPQTKSFAGVREALEWAVEYALGEPGVVDPSTPYELRRDLTTGIILEPGMSMWDLIENLALRGGWRIFCDHLNVWQIVPKVTEASTSAAYLRTGADGTVDRFTHLFDADPYYDGAILKYTWDDSNGNEQIVYGKWTPPATALGQLYGAGRKVFLQDRTGPITQAEADAAAQLTVKNLSTRGDSYTVDSVIMWWLRPGDTVQLSLSDGTDVRHIVKRVTFNLNTGKMTVETREPSNLGDEA